MQAINMNTNQNGNQNGMAPPINQQNNNINNSQDVNSQPSNSGSQLTPKPNKPFLDEIHIENVKTDDPICQECLSGINSKSEEICRLCQQKLEIEKQHGILSQKISEVNNLQYSGASYPQKKDDPNQVKQNSGFNSQS